MKLTMNSKMPLKLWKQVTRSRYMTKRKRAYNRYLGSINGYSIFEHITNC